MFILDVAKILNAAEWRGDTTQAAIARRTGIAESSVSRILRGEDQPNLSSAMRLAEAYSLDLRDVIKNSAEETVA